MRRWIALVGLAGLAGCAGLKDTFTAKGGTAARAGGQTLSAERLATILAGAKGIQLNQDAAQFVANLWVDYALFAQAGSKGLSFSDSATIAAGLWPEIAELRTNRWHDTVVSTLTGVGPGAVDSAYDGNEVRVFQHLLIGAQQNAPAEQRAAARRRAEGLVARARSGDFGALAAQLSDDPGSKADRGFLPPNPRGAYVPSFDSAGWTLEPGAVSGVVESPFGYHIIRRPTKAEVASRLEPFVQQRAAQKGDSAFAANLQQGYKLTIVKEAPARLKAALADMGGQWGSGAVVATYTGGKVTAGEFLKWVRVLPPQVVAQLRQADDSALTQFAKLLSTNLLLLRQADSAKVSITPEEWTALKERFTQAVEQVSRDLDAAADSGSAAAKVDAYFDKLVAGSVRIAPLPPGLSTVLREKLGFSAYPAGLQKALEIARSRQAADSSAAAATPGPNAPVRPAPGGPPVPGAAPAPAPAPAPTP